MTTSRRIHYTFRNPALRLSLQQIGAHLQQTTGVRYTLNDLINMGVLLLVENYRDESPEIFRPMRLEITPAHQVIIELTRRAPKEPRKLYEAVCRWRNVTKDAFAGFLEDLIAARRIQQVIRAADKNVDQVLYVAANAPLGNRYQTCHVRVDYASEQEE